MASAAVGEPWNAATVLDGYKAHVMRVFRVQTTPLLHSTCVFDSKRALLLAPGCHFLRDRTGNDCYVWVLPVILVAVAVPILTLHH